MGWVQAWVWITIRYTITILKTLKLFCKWEKEFVLALTSSEEVVNYMKSYVLEEYS